MNRKLDLSKLKTKIINDTFIEIDYLGENIILNINDNYLNVGKILSKYGSDFGQWNRGRNKNYLDKVQEILMKDIPAYTDAASNEDNNYIKNVYYEIRGNNEIKGTYVNPLIAPHILSWISDDISIKVAMMINQSSIEKECEIFDLKNMNKKLDIQHRETITELKNIQNQNKDILLDNSNLSIKLDIVDIKISDHNTDVEVIEDNTFPKLDSIAIALPTLHDEDIESFCIIETGSNQYYVFRRKYKSIKQLLKTYKNQIRYYINTNNSIALFDHLKNSKLIIYKYNAFLLESNISFIDIIKFIVKTLNDLKEPINNIKNSVKNLKIDLENL